MKRIVVFRSIVAYAFRLSEDGETLQLTFVVFALFAKVVDVDTRCSINGLKKFDKLVIFLGRLACL